MYAALQSIGSYVPPNTLTNKDFEKIVDTTDEWIFKRTGIKNRHIADADQATSDLGVEAAKIALQRADIDKDAIDMVICATISPDYLCMPSTACVISDKLGIHNVTAFDISAACSGFVYLLSIAKAYIESGMKKNILVIGAEKLSSIVDYSDRSTCVLFGDGAGAAVISGVDDKKDAIIDIHTSADGAYGDFLITPGCGSKHPCSPDVIENHMQFMKMRGNETFKVAVKTLTKDVIDILHSNNIQSVDIDHFIPHQANYRIINAVGKALNLTPQQVVLTVAKYGNTSSASVPMAMNERYESGLLKRGDLMLLDTFGGGLTWGSALLPFNGKNFADL